MKIYNAKAKDSKFKDGLDALPTPTDLSLVNSLTLDLISWTLVGTILWNSIKYLK